MPIHDSATRPARPGYSFANHGAAASSNSASVGKHVLKRVPGVDLWGPAWGHETIIRVYPAVSAENKNEFSPYRFSNGYCDFSDWIRVYDAVRNFGNPGVTMLLHDGMNPSYDAQLMNPCWILHRAINQALAQGQGLGDWVPLTKGSTGKGAVLAKPGKLYLVQCAIFRHKSENTFGPGKPPLGAKPDGGPTIVMALPATAGEGLLRLLEEKEEGWTGDPESYDQYKYGDPVAIDSGRFVHIYEHGKDPRTRFAPGRAAPNPASIYSSAPASSMGGGRMEPKGYGVFITNTLDGDANDVPANLTGYEDMVRAKVKPWESILDFKSDEEQAHLVAPLFPASAILYAWRDHQAWIPESVREAGNYEARRPVSSSAPSALQPGHGWAAAPRPAVGKGQATWGNKTPAPQEEEDVPDFHVTDNVVPNGEIPVTGAEADPLLVADEASKANDARNKLKAAEKAANNRRTK